jgi:hypothetical protein
LKFEVHPSYVYIINQMNSFKSQFDSYSDIEKQVYYQQRQMVFFDFFERSYKVDIYALAASQEKKLDEIDMLKGIDSQQGTE